MKINEGQWGRKNVCFDDDETFSRDRKIWVIKMGNRGEYRNKMEWFG